MACLATVPRSAPMPYAAAIELRTADTAAFPICPPTSWAPTSAVTSVFLTRFSTPTEMISPLLIATRIASSMPRGLELVDVAGGVSEADRGFRSGMVSSVNIVGNGWTDAEGAAGLRDQARCRHAGRDERPVAHRHRDESEQPAQRW